MEENKSLIESLFDKVEAYSKTNIDLYKLKAIDKSADIASSLATKLFFVKIVSIIAVIFSIGLALWISDMTGKAYTGFFYVSAFYLVAALILYLFRKVLIKTPISNTIIKQLFKEIDHVKN